MSVLSKKSIFEKLGFSDKGGGSPEGSDNKGESKGEIKSNPELENISKDKDAKKDETKSDKKEKIKGSEEAKLPVKDEAKNSKLKDDAVKDTDKNNKVDQVDAKKEVNQGEKLKDTDDKKAEDSTKKLEDDKKELKSAKDADKESNIKKEVLDQKIPKDEKPLKKEVSDAIDTLFTKEHPVDDKNVDKAKIDDKSAKDEPNSNVDSIKKEDSVQKINKEEDKESEKINKESSKSLQENLTQEPIKEDITVKNDAVIEKSTNSVEPSQENSFDYIDEAEAYEDTQLEEWMSIANIIQNENNEEELDKIDESQVKSDLTQNEVLQRTKDALFEMRAWANDGRKDDGVTGSYSLGYQRQGEKVMVNSPLESNDKIQTVEEIYQKSQMEVEKLKTIFMVDEFSRTLPENLPVDVKRTSVTNIINVSGMKVENFLNDAYKRMDALNQVLEHSVQNTEDIIAKKRDAIKSLESEIAKLEQFIADREQFQDKQTSLIEYEVQRIVGIVDFIKP